jgi:pimeloyl-ACP methyl ester carboxylesterase
MPLTAAQPRRGHFSSLSAHGFHRVNYWDWGDPGSPRVAICVHGLARNARDFDVIAELLAATHRVLAVDMPGRGDSEWLADAGDYGLPTYLATLNALVARAGADAVDWIGTSMGGLLGMVIAAQRGSPIARLVVNDVGPVIEPEALARIGSYVGVDPTFASFNEIEDYVRTISAPFGPLTDAQWQHLTATNVRQRADGRWGLAYDPGIAVPFRTAPAPADLWGVWDAIRCPTLVLRGADSDLLSAATARQMRERGPRAEVIEFAGVGHAPMLLEPAQCAPVVAFLRGTASALPG